MASCISARRFATKQNAGTYSLAKLFVVLASCLAMVSAARGQPGWVLSHQKISSTEGNFTGILDNGDFFGTSAAALGDLDGDGVDDIAVGAIRDDDGGLWRGAVWVLFLNTDGTVKSHQKISDTEGGFTGTLDNEDEFGLSVASLGEWVTITMVAPCS